jgi:hypothetical protein
MSLLITSASTAPVAVDSASESAHSALGMRPEEPRLELAMVSQVAAKAGAAALRGDARWRMFIILVRDGLGACPWDRLDSDSVEATDSAEARESVRPASPSPRMAHACCGDKDVWHGRCSRRLPCTQKWAPALQLKVRQGLGESEHAIRFSNGDWSALFLRPTHKSGYSFELTEQMRLARSARPAPMMYCSRLGRIRPEQKTVL